MSETTTTTIKTVPWPEPGGPRLQWFWRLYFRLQNLLHSRRNARLNREDRQAAKCWEATR